MRFGDCKPDNPAWTIVPGRVVEQRARKGECDAMDCHPSDVSAGALRESREGEREQDVLSIICSLLYQTLQRGKKKTRLSYGNISCSN